MLYIAVNNHFDPIWRRCWERRFRFRGEIFASYADLEEYYMLDNLELARKHAEYRFQAESAIVARKFLERHPEREAELRRLVEKGRFAVTGGGDNIVDSNMVLGESLVRNFLLGLLWVEERLGQKTGLAVRNDAFGNSAQLPQILRGCEMKWATGMSYSPAGGWYWRGLDGSCVLHATIPLAAVAGGNRKYAPCPECRGEGCEACGGRGIEARFRAELPSSIDEKAVAEAGMGLVRMMPEELLPNPQLVSWAKAMGDRYEVRFALEEELAGAMRERLERVDDPPADQLHEGVELNPNNSGVWLTRIRIKQTCRRQERALLATEGLAAMAAMAGGIYPREAANRVWRDLLFTMFHDALTATHVDPAYAEMQEFWKRIDAGIGALREGVLAKLVRPQAGCVSVINALGRGTTQVARGMVEAGSTRIGLVDEAGTAAPVLATRRVGDGRVEVEFVAGEVPALGARCFRVVSAEVDPNEVAALNEPVIENGRFRIVADERGLLSIRDKQLGVDVAKGEEYRPGELILERDEGSPWATLHPDQSRTPLAEYTRLVAAERGAHWQRLVFEVLPPGRVGHVSFGLKGTVEVRLMEGVERVDFRVRAWWDTFNHRLRVAVPVPHAGRHLYGIPYGALEREPYAPDFGWTGANGDWPAVEWAGVDAGQVSVALLNRGLPSYRMESTGEGERMLLSLVRSPAIPTYLHEPEFYTMSEWDGMRDAGEHEFEFALTAYEGELLEGGVVVDAEGYNGGLVAVSGGVELPEVPGVESESVRLAAAKWGEQREGLVLRLCEFRGKGGEVTVNVPEGFERVARTNLLERGDEELEVSEGRVRLSLRAWEIATVVVE